MNLKLNDTPKRVTYFYYAKSLIDAFKVDCEKFLRQFESLHSLKYSDFTRIWQQFNFSYIFGGQTVLVVIKQFCEGIFFNLNKYIVFSDNIYVQIGALYLLYGLYYKQPLKCWVKIRLVLEEYKALMSLMEKMKERQEFEPVYIFSKLKIENAFLFVAQRQQLGPEDRFIRFKEPFTNDLFKCTGTDEAYSKYEVLHQSSLSELEKVNGEYEAALKKYSEKCSSVGQFESTIIKDLTDAHSKLFEYKNVTPISAIDSDVEIPVTIVERRKKIRKKAMSRFKGETENAV